MHHHYRHCRFNCRIGENWYKGSMEVAIPIHESHSTEGIAAFLAKKPTWEVLRYRDLEKVVIFSAHVEELEFTAEPFAMNKPGYNKVDWAIEDEANGVGRYYQEPVTSPAQEPVETVKMPEFTDLSESTKSILGI